MEDKYRRRDELILRDYGLVLGSGGSGVVNYGRIWKYTNEHMFAVVDMLRATNGESGVLPGKEACFGVLGNGSLAAHRYIMCQQRREGENQWLSCYPGSIDVFLSVWMNPCSLWHVGMVPRAFVELQTLF